MFELATSLDPPETSSHRPDDPVDTSVASIAPSDVIFRHSGWQPVRARVARCLEIVFGEGARVERFGACGTGAWVWQSATEPGRYKITADYCHDRWCLPCGRSRGRTIARNLAAYLDNKRLRFVTLTLRHRDEPLTDSLDRLYVSFGRLRRCRDWRAAVDGGVAFVEIKHGLDDSTWHPHLHILVEGRYLPHASLKAHWLRITEDSYIVDIRAVRSHDHLVRYVTKYVSKPLDSSVYATDATLCEAMRAMHGRRTCLTFGTWRGLDLTEDDDDTEWISMGPLGIVIDEARAGDIDAQAAIIGLRLETAQWDTTPTSRDPPGRPPLTTSP